MVLIQTMEIQIQIDRDKGRGFNLLKAREVTQNFTKYLK